MSILDEEYDNIDRNVRHEAKESAKITKMVQSIFLHIDQRSHRKYTITVKFHGVDNRGPRYKSFEVAPYKGNSSTDDILREIYRVRQEIFKDLQYYEATHVHIDKHYRILMQ